MYSVKERNFALSDFETEFLRKTSKGWYFKTQFSLCEISEDNVQVIYDNI